MKTKLLRKLRKKYSNKYKLIHYSKSWKVVFGNYKFASTFTTKKEALEYVRSYVDMEINGYINSHKRGKTITSKMLYG